MRVLGDLAFVYVGGSLSGYGTVTAMPPHFEWLREPRLSERRREEAETMALRLAFGAARGARRIERLSPPSERCPTVVLS